MGITVNATTSATNLYPGGPAQPLAGNFNNSNAGAVYVASVTAALGTLPTGCLPADFTIAGTALVGANVASGTGVGSWSGLTITMNNTGVSQNACKAASIPLVLTSNELRLLGGQRPGSLPHFLGVLNPSSNVCASEEAPLWSLR